MNRALLIIIPVVVVVVLALVVLAGAVYIIDESQQVVITQFGKVIGDPISEPGLHFKAPFIQDANYFDKRLLDWEGEKTVIKTVEQKFIYVEVYARWRISDPRRFLETVSGRFEIASSQLDAIIDPIVRDIIAKYELRELVRSDTGKEISEGGLGMEEDDFLKDLSAEDILEAGGTKAGEPVTEAEPSAVEQLTVGEEAARQQKLKIEFGRNFIVNEIFERAKEKVQRFGIVLADVRVPRINYQPATRQQVYNRMIAERQRITARYISEGEQKSAELIGQKDRILKEIQSRAQKRELEILGEGEAQSIKTYADAYSKDVNFYSFLKTLETLRSTVDSGTWLILSTDSDLYRILKDLESLR